jgi:hypothetical protein
LASARGDLERLRLHLTPARISPKGFRHRDGYFLESKASKLFVKASWLLGDVEFGMMREWV